MHFARDITILLVGLALVSAAPRQASAQSELEADSDLSAQTEVESDFDKTAITTVTAAALIEQRALAQAGLGQAFMFRLLHSQMSIGDAENDGQVGKCKALEFGASIKLKRRIGTFVRQATVEVYYDAHCKDVFISSLLTVDEKTKDHFSIVETATVHKPRASGKPIGTVSGKLSLTSLVTKTSSVVNFAGTGTWTPTGGTKALGALKCDYPRKLKAGKNFTCSFAMAQRFNNLNIDIASAMALKFKVANAPTGTFTGDFTGPVQLFTGKFGKLGVAAPAKGSAAVTGTRKSIGTAAAKGSVRLTVFWPPPSSWTVTDAAHAQKFAITMVKGQTRESLGTIASATKTLATFSVDKTGEGLITYSDRKKAKIVNWVLAN